MAQTEQASTQLILPRRTDPFCKVDLSGEVCAIISSVSQSYIGFQISRIIMGFYFAVHTLLGLILGSASLLAIQAQNDDEGSVPFWVHTRGHQFQLIAGASCLLAVVTTFINYSFLWAIATVVEIFFGMFLSSLLNMSQRAFFVITSILSIPVIMGALWKFWYL